MNYGVDNIHFVAKYENLNSTFFNESSKTSSGTLKWMNIKM